MESRDALEAFLVWLGRNQAAGAREYEEVRRKLIALFRCRGCWSAEDLADETIDRTARAVTKPGFRYEGEPVAYFRGVARNVYLEWLRRERRHPKEPISDEHPRPEAPWSVADVRETLSACLDSCLEKLPEPKRDILLRYYRHDRRAKIDERQRVAEEQGMALNALRIQVFRLRSVVRACVEQCHRRDEIKGKTKSSLK